MFHRSPMCGYSFTKETLMHGKINLTDLNLKGNRNRVEADGSRNIHSATAAQVLFVTVRKIQNDKIK